MKGYTRRSVVVLAIVAMIAALLAVPVTAGAATPATASYKAGYSACPSGDITASSFTDSATSFAKADIDCMAYYGISKGTSATTFDPSSAVTREQMALFLIRAAGPAGVTLGAGADQGFTDISGLSAESQLAINQLAELGITKGTSTTTYGPAGTVTREQMALFIRRFLSKAAEGPGGMLTAIAAATDQKVDFTDIAGVSFEAYGAILDLFELGVTTGTTATTFSPSLSVTREQMAAFIGRALAHTNARPAGTSIQFKSDGSEASVSYRDSAFMPVANQPIDYFYQDWSATATQKAPLDANGLCIAANLAGGSGTLCTIDNADLFTDLKGNAVASGWTVTAGHTLLVWAWGDALGTVFDADTQQFSADTFVVPALIDYPTGFKTSVDTPLGAAAYAAAPFTGYTTVHFGKAFTLTMTATGGTTADLSKAEFTVKETRTFADGSVTVTTTKVSPNASGVATYAVAAATDVDPTDILAVPATDEVGVVLDVTATKTDTAKTAIGGTVTSKLVASDDADAYQTTSLSSSIDWAEVTTAGTSVTWTAKAIDQYGDGWAGAVVDFNGTSAVTAPQRTTNSAGMASATTTEGTSNAKVSVDIDVDRDGAGPTAKDLAVDSTDVFFADELVATTTPAGPFTVNVWDAANDAIVFFGGTNYRVVYYDADDQFNLTAGTTYAAFDKAVGAEPLAGVYTKISYGAYVEKATVGGGVSNFTLS